MSPTPWPSWSGPHLEPKSISFSWSTAWWVGKVGRPPSGCSLPWASTRYRPCGQAPCTRCGSARSAEPTRARPLPPSSQQVRLRAGGRPGEGRGRGASGYRRGRGHPGREMVCAPASTNITCNARGKQKVSGGPGEVASQDGGAPATCGGESWVPILLLLPARSVTWHNSSPRVSHLSFIKWNVCPEVTDTSPLLTQRAILWEFSDPSWRHLIAICWKQW